VPQLLFIFSPYPTGSHREGVYTKGEDKANYKKARMLDGGEADDKIVAVLEKDAVLRALPRY
jgi:hypothetical protein